MASGPEVKLLGGAATRCALYLDEPFTIGRAHGNGIRLAHDEVEELHCEFLWANDIVTLSDFAGGTLRNGQAVGVVQVMAHGDQVQIGPYCLEFAWPDQPAPKEKAEQRASSSSIQPILPPTSPASFEIRQVLFRGEEVHSVPLADGLRIGTNPDCDVYLPEIGGEFSRQTTLEVSISQAPRGFTVSTPGAQEGVFINSRFFHSHELIIGDYLQLGSYHFRFDGLALVAVDSSTGGAIEARDLGVTIGKTDILRGANFSARPGQFIGILGPSGAGKTTLLNALSGMMPISAGRILMNGVDTSNDAGARRSLLGYVPQDDIVHRELTVRQALDFSARLRLPDHTPRHEIVKLVEKTAEHLGLEHLLDRSINALSGGQRKRVSVGVELLNRPQILFLDEPTSGLDPGTEFQLMKLLRGLTSTGCTVICTTHLMENVYLMDSVTVVQDGRSVFHGDSMQAREHFGISKLTQLYDTLAHKTADEWALQAPSWSACQVTADRLPGKREFGRSPLRALLTLLSRHASIVKSDVRNLLLLLGQPILIGLLVAFVAVTAKASGTKLFLAYIVALWFGCSNSAQEIVREKPIFRREKFVGLSSHAYLLSKFGGMGLVTCLQALLVWFIIRLPLHGSPLKGAASWQLASLLGSSLAATGIGLAVSAWAKKPTQAILLVPLLIIPQILFSGYVFRLGDWDGEKANGHPFVRSTAHFVPSFSAQRLMDTSLLWKVKIDASEEDGSLWHARENLETALRPMRAIAVKHPIDFTLDETKIYASSMGKPLEPAKRIPAQEGWPELRSGLVYKHASPAVQSLLALASWALASYLAAATFLRKV